MAGIKEALKRVMENRNVGRVVAMGEIENDSDSSDRSPTKYMIIEMEKDKGRITVYDYGSDIRFEEGLQIGGRTMLLIRDNWCAEWCRWDEEKGSIKSRDSSTVPVPCLDLVRFSLMTNGNGGQTPEYKYWIVQVDKNRNRSDGCGGCAESFMEAVNRIKKYCPKAFLVGIFDGFTERGTYKERFKNVVGIPVCDVRESHERYFISLGFKKNE